MEQKYNFQIHINEKVWLGCIVVFALVLRLLIGGCYYNGFDTVSYNIPWAEGVRQGLFNAYSHVESLNYPPLFPTLLFFISGPIHHAVEIQSGFLQMFWIKLIPILFDIGLVVLLYAIGKKYNQLCGIFLSTMWALNISTIFNCSFWGQTDSMLLFWIAAMFFSFQRKRPTLACIFFALGCLTKLQMAYLAPILLLELFLYYKPKVAFSAIGIGVGVGALGWLPFIIGSHNLLLPLNIYLGGFDEYNYINLNAFNLYGIGSNNWKPDSSPFFGSFTYQDWGTLVSVLLLIGIVFIYLYLRWQKRHIPAVLHATMFMNAIFLFSTKMHERYQIPVVILSLLCFVFCQNWKMFYGYLGVTAITFINQAAFLLKANFQGGFSTYFEFVQRVGSIFNLILFVYLLYLYVDFIFRPIEPNLPQQNKIL